MHWSKVIQKGAVAAIAIVVGMVTLGPQSRLAGAESVGSTPRPYILTYNVCGGTCFKEFTTEEWNRKIINVIEETDADVVLFQELCRGQYVSLQSSLGSGYDSRWVATMSDNRGCAKQWPDDVSEEESYGFGLGVFIKGGDSIRDSILYKLPNPKDDEPRALICVDAEIQGRMTLVCNTHLDWHPDTEADQAKYVASVVNRWANQRPVIFGGDLNGEPRFRSLDDFYSHSGGRGPFLEAGDTDKRYFKHPCSKSDTHCRSGAPTVPLRKIDYIFLSGRHFEFEEGDTERNEEELSDHRLLRGAASYR